MTFRAGQGITKGKMSKKLITLAALPMLVWLTSVPAKAMLFSTNPGLLGHQHGTFVFVSRPYPPLRFLPVTAKE